MARRSPLCAVHEDASFAGRWHRRHAHARAHDVAGRQIPGPAAAVGRRCAATQSEDRRAHDAAAGRSEEHTSELQSLMRISYAVFCLKKKKKREKHTNIKQ